jgi:hypothetical protein
VAERGGTASIDPPHPEHNVDKVDRETEKGTKEDKVETVWE